MKTTEDFLPFLEPLAALQRLLVRISNIDLRLPTPEDLIIMKAVAHRPQDLLDIEALIASSPDLDRGRIRRWVQEFAAALDAPEIWDDLVGYLA